MRDRRVAPREDRFTPPIPLPFLPSHPAADSHCLHRAGLSPLPRGARCAAGASGRAPLRPAGARHHARRCFASGLPRAHSRGGVGRRGGLRILRRRRSPAGASRGYAPRASLLASVKSRIMTFQELTSSPGVVHEEDPAAVERLSLGVAARLSRYLQVLTQAKKMGKETISSQELSDYTHVNSTQIRRDLSGFGKFGKRGVGYNVEALGSQIRKILRTAGPHNIALLGAGHLGKAIASSDIFADHGFRVVAIFDSDHEKVGTQVGNQAVRHISELRQVVEDEDIVVGVMAVPTQAAQGLADELVEAGGKIIFNYSQSLIDGPPGVTVHPSSPAVDLLYALYFYLT